MDVTKLALICLVISAPAGVYVLALYTLLRELKKPLREVYAWVACEVLTASIAATGTAAAISNMANQGIQRDVVIGAFLSGGGYFWGTLAAALSVRVFLQHKYRSLNA